MHGGGDVYFHRRREAGADQAVEVAEQSDEGVARGLPPIQGAGVSARAPRQWGNEHCCVGDADAKLVTDCASAQPPL